MIYEHSELSRRAAGPRIAAIGGGHGLSTMLRGLKQYTENISAIVTVADDGGGSGMLHSREDIPWEEFTQYPDWYGTGLKQVEELWEERGTQVKCVRDFLPRGDLLA